MIRFKAALSATLLALATPALAAPCSDTGGQYESWKPVMAQEAAAVGVGQAGIAALMGSSYAKGTISADRNQKSFKYTLDKFLQVRGADAIVSQGRKRKAKNPGFYSALESQYGVSAGVLIAIHGMETGFGGFMGDSNVISAIATLAYDCRRSDFFTPHLLSALILVDQGAISPRTVGAKHGELGHTQFLPGNALQYGVDGDGDGRVDLMQHDRCHGLDREFPAPKGLAARAWLSGRRAELCRDQAMERRHRLSAGHRADGRKNRRLRYDFPLAPAWWLA
ncbi:MAG: lytic murein transglycosylase [Gemmobacter sp.]|nr:lytic murein transglycosylase [Gemmobacter sp.]